MLYRLLKFCVSACNLIYPGQTLQCQQGTRKAFIHFWMRLTVFCILLPVILGISIDSARVATRSLKSLEDALDEVASYDTENGLSFTLTPDERDARLLAIKTSLTGASDTLSLQIRCSLLFFFLLSFLIAKLLLRDMNMISGRANAEKLMMRRARLAFRLERDDERLPLLHKQVGMLMYHLDCSLALMRDIPYEDFVTDSLYYVAIKGGRESMANTGLPIVRPFEVKGTAEYSFKEAADKRIAECVEREHRFDELVQVSVADELRQYDSREQILKEGEQRLEKAQQSLAAQRQSFDGQKAQLARDLKILESDQRQVQQEMARVSTLDAKLAVREQEVEDRLEETRTWVQRLDAWTQQIGKEAVDERKPPAQTEAQ